MSKLSGLRAVAASGAALMRWGAAPGRYGAWFIFLLTLVVILTVIAAQFGLSAIASWDFRLPLLGNHLNVTGLAELQWHLFALLIMIAIVYAFSEDQHIRVDVISSRFSERTRTIIDIVGDLFLLIPFLALLLWYSIAFTQMAYNFGEQSNSGGLVDRYLVKAVLPLGCVLFLIAAVGRVLRNVARMLGEDRNDGGRREGKQ
jgi:TRAP-type mannitol/chloroaromatic compound transport system permease small subunit